MTTFTAASLAELASIAPQIIDALGESRVVAFRAPMGAGKTTLIKELCAAIGTDATVNSPTFAIVNDYPANNGTSIFHFDLYRLKGLAEAIDMGCEDYFYSGDYCFIEWPDIIDELLPSDTRTITISVDESGTRHITLE